MKAKEPFFIIGLPRSGTKLFRDLINSQDAVWIPDVESNFIPFYASEVESIDLSDYEQFKLLAKKISNSKSFMYWSEKGYDLDFKKWHVSCSDYSYAGIVAGLFKLVYKQEKLQDENALEWNSLFWGDKSPSYINHVNSLANIYPSAKFIHIVRDPRDVAVSAKMAWGKNELRTVQRWCDCINKARGFFKENSEKFLEIKYEDLLSDPKKVMCLTFEFLNIPYDTNQIKLSSSAENLGSAKGKDYIVSDNYNKFREQLAEKQRRRMEQISGVLLDSYGYLREYPEEKLQRVPNIKMLYYKIIDGVSLLMFAKNYWGGWRQAFKFVLSR